MSLLAYAYTSIFGLGLGVSTGIVYFKSEDPIHRQSTIVTSFILLAISSIVLLMFCSVGGSFISTVAFRNDRFASIILLHAAGIGLQITAQPFLWKLQFENRAVPYAVFLFCGAAITMAAILTLVVWSERGVRGWVEGVVIGNSSLLVSLLISKNGYQAVLNRLYQVPELLRLGFPHIPGFAFVFLVQYSGIYMLEWYVPMDQIGIYGIGHTIGLSLGLATAAFTTAWYPFFNSFVARQSEARRVFPRVLSYYVLGFGVVCFMFFLLAKPAIVLLTDSRYHMAYAVVGLVALSQFWIGMWSLHLPGMYFAGETSYVPAVQAIVAICVLGLNLLLMPRLGIEGAALSLAGGGFLLVVVQDWLNKIRGYSYPSWSAEWPLLGTFMAVVVVQIVISRTLSVSNGAIAGTILLAIYLSVAWLCLPNNERVQVRYWISRRMPAFL